MYWLAIVLALTTNTPEPCVSLQVRNAGVDDVLRELNAQTRVNLALDARLRGRVTIDVECVPLRVALQQIAAQLDAAYCEEGKTIYIGRRNGSCPAQWSSPPFERVAHHD